MEIIKKNITLILGISIPILLILFVAASIYLPNLFVEPPKFNFLYVVGNDYNYIEQYSVQDNKLVKTEIIQPENVIYKLPVDDSKLFIYDVVKNESKEVNFDEAQKLNLDSSNVSPDGFEIAYGSTSNGFFPFFFSSTDYEVQYLKGHNISRKLNIPIDGSRPYYYNFRFLGWIKN